MAKNPARGHNIIAKNVIPNLVGMTRTTAQTLLSSLGFTYTETSENTEDSAQNDRVSAQSINAGNTELLGTNVPYTYKTFSFAPFGFTPVAPFGFTPFSFTPFGFAPVAFSFFNFAFTPFGAFGFLNFGFSPSQCLHEDIFIKTANGVIQVKDLSIGDTIFSVDLEEVNDNNSLSLNSSKLTGRNLMPVEIDNIQRSEKDLVISFNEIEDKFSQEQPFFIKRDGVYSVIPAGLIDQGDYIIKVTENGQLEEVLIESVQVHSGNFQVYSISLSSNQWYIAGEYLVHTK